MRFDKLTAVSVGNRGAGASHFDKLGTGESDHVRIQE
jgi:hypothetical protein